MERTRTIHWQDPLITAEAARTMSGLEALRAIVSGDLPPPPFAVLLGIDLDEVEPGRVTFRMVPAEFHYNPIGSVHGGVISTLCDSAMGCAVHSLLPAGAGYTTLELKANFIRPLTRDTGPIVCEGRAIHVGRQTGIAEAQVLDAAGTLYAHATTTCLIFRQRHA